VFGPRPAIPRPREIASAPVLTSNRRPRYDPLRLGTSHRSRLVTSEIWRICLTLRFCHAALAKTLDSCSPLRPSAPIGWVTSFASTLPELSNRCTAPRKVPSTHLCKAKDSFCIHSRLCVVHSYSLSCIPEQPKTPRPFSGSSAVAASNSRTVYKHNNTTPIFCQRQQRCRVWWKESNDSVESDQECKTKGSK